jgi:exonuclease III
MIMDSISLFSQNCQGLNGSAKRRDVFNYLKNKKHSIYCLQDVHFSKDQLTQIRSEWGLDCVFNSFSSNSRGVAILFSDTFEYTLHRVKKCDAGNSLAVDIEIGGFRITLINIYAPNEDNPDFHKMVSDIIDEYENPFTIICGDFNLVLDPKLDTQNYVAVNNPRARNTVLQTINDYNLCDPWRIHNPTVRQFTWRKKTPLKQARLDFFLLSEELLAMVNHSDIVPGYRTDHSAIKLKLDLKKIDRGRGFWKFNNSLLKDQSYIDKVKEIILETKCQYAASPYLYQKINSVACDKLHLTISDQLFFETILLNIRTMTLPYSAKKKREQIKQEDELEKLIFTLESQINIDLNLDTFDQLDEAKKDLETLRKIKMEGAMIRSRANWIEYGEKPTKYFCALEKRNYISKCIPKLVTSDSTLHNPKEISREILNFYTNLYTSREQNLNDFDALSFKKEYDFPVLTQQSMDNIEGEITYNEAVIALKRMKNNKSPGSDGFTVEFF